jgi:hypothetical protein
VLVVHVTGQVPQLSRGQFHERASCGVLVVLGSGVLMMTRAGGGTDNPAGATRSHVYETTTVPVIWL